MNVIVVGAGVSGLVAANVMHSCGMKVTVLEWSDSVGGRVRSMRSANGTHLGDLGPSWVWPPYQPELSRWLDLLDVQTMEQFEDGDGCIERLPSQPVQHTPLPSQHGQRRPVGGPQVIVDTLLGRLPQACVQNGVCVVSVCQSDGALELKSDKGDRFVAEQVVLAAPLRVIARDVTFDPPLPAPLSRALEHSPTWMASQAKALIVYEKPFWRTQGLSGRIASTIGPLVEAHDHSGEYGSPAALVGFIGIDAGDRAVIAQDHGPEALGQAVVEQLVRCFGQEAANPRAIQIKDWASEPGIATHWDIEYPGGHPSVLMPLVRESYLSGRLHFAVAETSMLSPGLLEGAFVAGERAARNVVGAGLSAP